MGFSKAQGFELVGDGQANNLPALRSMMQEAEQNGRATILLPAGRFWLQPEKKETALVIPASVRLQGAGIDKTILVMADNAFGHVVSAPFGWVQIADVTIDRNRDNRPGIVGHNLRVNGENCIVERVKCINAVSYGIGVGQRHYARNLIVRDVEIARTGADGIDVKDVLNRTSDIRIERVVVWKFGLPDRQLAPAAVGSDLDRRRRQAGVDLRGANCRVENLRVDGVLKRRTGLRFRPGEIGTLHGPGAHSGVAKDITINGKPGSPQGIGIFVASRDVVVSGLKARGMGVAVQVLAENFVLNESEISHSQHRSVHVHSILASEHRIAAQPERASFNSVVFDGDNPLVSDGTGSISFDRCTFRRCKRNVEADLSAQRNVRLADCRFDRSCSS